MKSYQQVREVPKNYRNVTGRWPSLKTGSQVPFESTLERDFIILHDIDPAVKRITAQPIRIEYKDIHGKNRSYTPDFVLQFCDDINRPDTLYEVKYRSDLAENWDIYKPKFKAALSYAKLFGLRFKIFTEVEIKGPLLENARFLSKYLFVHDNDALHQEWVSSIKEHIVPLGICSIEKLLACLASSKMQKAEALAHIWRMVAQNNLGANLTLPLSNATEIWWPNAID